MDNVVKEFTKKTNQLFNKIKGLSAEELAEIVYQLVEDVLYMCDLNVEIKEVVLTGSRCRGLETETSDLDFVVSFTGNEREDKLFNILNEKENEIEGVKIDINPLVEERSGSLDEYLLIVEDYLTKKAGVMH